MYDEIDLWQISGSVLCLLRFFCTSAQAQLRKGLSQNV